MDLIDDDLLVAHDDDDGDDFEQTMEAHIKRHKAAQSARGSRPRGGGTRPASATQRRREAQKPSAVIHTAAKGVYSAAVPGSSRYKRQKKGRRRPTSAQSPAAGRAVGRSRRRPASAMASRDVVGDEAAEVGAAVRAAMGRELPQPLMRPGSSRRSRPSSATSRTKRRVKTRPWSAMAPRTANSYQVAMQKRHTGAPRGRKAVHSGDAMFSSVKQLRLLAAKKKAEQDEFAGALLAEEQEQLQAAHARVTQANLWASSLATGRNYRTLRVAKGGTGHGAGDLETRVVIHEPDGTSRDVSLDIFLREYEKLHRQALLVARQSSLPQSPTKGGKGNRSPSPLRKTGKAAKDSNVVGHYTYTLLGATAPRKRRPPKTEVQAELRAVLKETAQLTAVLQQQLEQLRSKGWNLPPGGKSTGHKPQFYSGNH